MKIIVKRILRVKSLKRQLFAYFFYVFSQLIFRKVADVRREKELAEKRKNEPQLDEQRDQLVRKIFTKFRKDRAPSQVLGMQQQSGGTAAAGADENKGEAAGQQPSADASDGSGGGGRPKVLPLVLRQQSDDNQQASCSTGPKPAPKKVSKWGKVLGGGGGGGGGGGSTDSADVSSVTAASMHSAPAKMRDSPGRQASGGNGHKVFPKLQKVPATAAAVDPLTLGQRQETIDETHERIIALSAAGTPAEPGETPDRPSVTVTASPPKPAVRPADAPSPPPPPCGPVLLPPPLDLDVLSKIEDLQADFKSDVASINQRLTAIEDVMQRIVNKLDALSAVPSPLLLQPPDTPPEMTRGCRTKSTDDLSSPVTPKLPPMVRRRRSKSRTRSSSSALPPMRPYSPRDTSPPPFPRCESLKKPLPPRPNDFL